MANVITGVATLQPSPNLSGRFTLLLTIARVHRARFRHRKEHRHQRADKCTAWLQQLNRELKNAPVGC